jgi:excisionase family DNA binding protein
VPVRFVYNWSDTPDMQPQDMFLSLEAAATYTALSIKTLRRRIAAGDLAASRSGRLIRVRVRDLDAMFERIPGAGWTE